MYRELYKDQLKDHRWNEKRKQIIARDKVCQFCGRSKRLHVHHISYIPNRLAWEYPNEYLILLCSKCHKNEHENMKKVLEVLSKMRLSGLTSNEIFNLINI
jgi:5-methylcytosine-specific restriction endonuclease McrA